MRVVCVPTFFAHGGVAQAGLKRSSLGAYWKAEEPWAGVKGEACRVKDAPETSVKAWVPSWRNVMPFFVAGEDGSADTRASASWTVCDEPPSERWYALSSEISWLPAITSFSSARMRPRRESAREMDEGVPSSVMSPQCRKTSQAGRFVGKTASWVSDMTRKRTGFVGRTFFELGDGVDESERSRFVVDILIWVQVFLDDDDDVEMGVTCRKRLEKKQKNTFEANKVLNTGAVPLSLWFVHCPYFSIAVVR